MATTETLRKFTLILSGRLSWSSLSGAALAIALPVAAETARIVDVHAHLSRMRGMEASTLAAASEAMDAMQVDRTIVMSPPRPPRPSGHRRPEVAPDIAGTTRQQPNRLAHAGGGDTLNTVLHSVAPNKVTPAVIERFRAQAQQIADSDAVAFGELAVEHLSSGRGGHPYVTTNADHPLLLELVKIAARHQMPVDIHMEAVPSDREIPFNFQRSPNPTHLRANIAAFERLLEHDRTCRVVWAHAGWDLTGDRTPALMRQLLERHPNLFMSIKIDRQRRSAPTAPFRGDGSVRPEWLELLAAFPDRFMIGSDQFYDEGTERLQMARQFIDQLPAELATRIASENALAVYRRLTK